jgi:hypothetical protein
MNPIRCEDFYEVMYAEADLPPEASRHLAECGRCRALVKDLEAIAAAAPSLAAHDPAPSERLWNSLRSDLIEEGLIRDVHPAWPAHAARWFDEVFSAVPRPALAGAYLAAILAVSLAVVGPLRQHFGESSSPAAEVAPSAASSLNAQLASYEQDAVASLGDSSPAVTASLQDSLALIDNHIALCEKSLREDPTSEATRDYLYEAYQQKADLLAEISERGALGR